MFIIIWVAYFLLSIILSLKIPKHLQTLLCVPISKHTEQKVGITHFTTRFYQSHLRIIIDSLHVMVVHVEAYVQAYVQAYVEPMLKANTGSWH